MSDQPKAPQYALLDDLESIRDLFAEQREETQAEVAAQVPLRDDPVDVAETQPPSLQQPRDSADPQPNDDLFQNLLGDAWRNSAAAVLEQARDTIGDNSPHWAPEYTDQLNAALKVRIDAAMQSWLRGMLIEHMADLHEHLLAVISEELPGLIDDIIGAGQQRRAKDTDGQ